jgi:uncharacterized protein (DUF58 family)
MLLAAAGHRVGVCSPDPAYDDGGATGLGDDAGGRLAALERQARLRALRRRGIPVVDWDAEPLPTAFARAGWLS